MKVYEDVPIPGLEVEPSAHKYVEPKRDPGPCHECMRDAERTRRKLKPRKSVVDAFGRPTYRCRRHTELLAVDRLLGRPPRLQIIHGGGGGPDTDEES